MAVFGTRFLLKGVIMTRTSFKGGSAGVLRPRVMSEKVAGMLPLMQDEKFKAGMELSLRNDKLKQIHQFETKRKL